MAYRFARYLSQPPSHLSQTTLVVPEDAQSAHLLAAGAHPNIFVLQRAMDQRAKRLKTEIAVDDAREAINSAHKVIESGSPAETDLREALREITKAATSVRVLADYLEEEPQALLRGKPAAKEEYK